MSQYLLKPEVKGDQTGFQKIEETEERNTNPIAHDDRCLECRGNLVPDYEIGELICKSCGVVRSGDDLRFSAIDTASAGELGSLIAEEQDSSMMYYVSLPGKIDSRDVDARGKHINDVADMNRLRHLNNVTISSDSKRKNLTRAASEIQRIGNSLGAGKSIVERAYEIYRKSIEDGTARRRSIQGMAEAAIYLACKERGITRSVGEIGHAGDGIQGKNINHYSKVLLKGAGMQVTTPDASSQVSRIASRAGLGGLTERTAIQILEKVKNEPLLAGKRPISVAAAALYLAANQQTGHATQIKIAYAAGVTTITLRKRAAEISKLLHGSGVEVPTPMELEVARPIAQ
jgi:transcription initiation factor TFIIB